MAVKYYDLNFESRRTYLGGVGYFDENEYRALRINVASVLEDYPSASFKVVFQRAKDSHPYEKAQSDVTLLGDKLVVTLNETDYNMPGRLLVQVTFVSGEVTGKSGIFIADVGKSLSSDTTDPQSPYADALKEIDDALEKIDDFLETGGGAISPEMIEEAVSNYLETNPIMETDPTVPEWAKAESKPSYSYNELTDKPAIPDAYTLPVASESVLGGVKPISKTDDMTQGVGVDSEGKLWALPGGGGSGGIPAVTTEGTSTAYTATIPEITELYHGLTIDVTFHTRNTSDNPTLNLNGYGDKFLYARQVSKSANAMVGIKKSFISSGGKFRLMYNGYGRWVCDSYVETEVSGGGTGRNTLTSGSYLVGNGTALVDLKTPAQVLADILPSTAADAGKVPTVQADGTIALAEVSGGGGASIHIGPDQPKNGALYWLDTSDAGLAVVDYPEEPEEPDEPEATLTGITATYTGGNVAVGTALPDLTGIVVTATYSDGSTEPVTGYTLSGTITEGSNTITVTYDGMTATFTVTGVAEEVPDEPAYIAITAVEGAHDLAETGHCITTFMEQYNTIRFSAITNTNTYLLPCKAGVPVTVWNFINKLVLDGNVSASVGASIIENAPSGTVVYGETGEVYDGSYTTTLGISWNTGVNAELSALIGESSTTSYVYATYTPAIDGYLVLNNDTSMMLYVEA